jgi:hypothetical protein
VKRLARPDPEVVLRGMMPGTNPTNYPATGIQYVVAAFAGYAVITGCRD